MQWQNVAISQPNISGAVATMDSRFDFSPWFDAKVQIADREKKLALYNFLVANRVTTAGSLFGLNLSKDLPLSTSIAARNALNRAISKLQGLHEGMWNFGSLLTLFFTEESQLPSVDSLESDTVTADASGSDSSYTSERLSPTFPGGTNPESVLQRRRLRGADDLK